MRPLIAVLLLSACVTESAEQVTEAATQAVTTTAIARGSEWRYWDGGGDLGTSWRGGYDDSTWASGAGPLGYGETYLETTVGYGPSATNKHITTYFRRTFTVDDPGAVDAMTAEVMYDDGFVVYLNGVEIQRTAMPAGTITASTRSSGHDAAGRYESFDWTGAAGSLVAGENVIAVEVHQVSPSSSGLVFDASLTIEAVDDGGGGGVDRRGAWYYWDEPGTPPASWKTQWTGAPPEWQHGSGPFGYGEGYLTTTLSYGSDPGNKPITTYFTTTFLLEDPTTVSEMIGEVMYDDGFVAYLNGTEIARGSMPAGAVGPSTLSIGHEAGNAYVTIDLTGRRDALEAGINVLAVEVHQASRTSSDLVFDMALVLQRDEPPPPPDEEDIARGSAWRYSDGATAPSADLTWAQREYNDASWPSGAGPLGYGESYVETTLSYGADPSSKPITAYFRRWFTVDDPTVHTRLIAELMYDDGVVVYLNGNEISRLHMPDGPITHTTRSTGHETGNNYEVYDWSHFAAYLEPGPNLLAVGVHQMSPSSSDLVFDLSLSVDTPPVCAVPGGGPAVPPRPHTGLADVWVGPTTAVAVGNLGTIARRSDAGGEWCWAATEPINIAWEAVWGSADDDVWIAGEMGHVLHYDGASFTPVDVGAWDDLVAISGTGPDDIWIVGFSGQVRHFDGTGWTAHDLPADKTLYSVWSHTVDDVWISGTEPAPHPDNPVDDGYSGIIYRWNPATADWDLQLKVTTYHGGASFWALHGTGPDDIWAVGRDAPSGAACSYSQVQHFDGTSWSYTGAPIECVGWFDVEAGAPGAEDGAWIVGSAEDGGAGAARYTGGAWIEHDAPETRSLHGIDSLGDRMWAAGSGYDDGWRQWIVRWDGTRWVQEW